MLARMDASKRLSRRSAAASILMVRPARFGANRETRASNTFQADDEGLDPAELLARARREFDCFASALRGAGVDVQAIEDSASPPKTDAVFPNNWISFHQRGAAVLYPLEAPSRRAEVRPEIIDQLEVSLGCRWPERVDLTPLVDEGVYLEGTGSLVLDRPRRSAYACRSSRTSDRGCRAFARALDYEVFAFDACDEGGVAIYHTNVLLSIGPTFAVACLDALPDPAERRELEHRLAQSGHEVIAITQTELREYCGNVLALESTAGEPLIALSQRARDGFEPAHRARLEAHGQLVSADLTTIETYGGGSARCMLAEVYRPGP